MAVIYSHCCHQGAGLSMTLGRVSRTKRTSSKNELKVLYVVSVHSVTAKVSSSHSANVSIPGRGRPLYILH